jgi:hypothetical protein
VDTTVCQYNVFLFVGMESELEVLNKLVSFKPELNVLHGHIQQPLNTAVAGTYVCELCGKRFKHRNSRYNHMAKHEGTTRCHICHQVLGQKSNMKRHLRHIHGVTGI